VTPNNSPSFGAIILAGGRSNRMGYPKPWLRYNEKQSFANKIVQTYRTFGCNRIVLVINSAFCENKWEKNLAEIPSSTKIFQNNQPSRGKIFSLCLAAPELLSCDHVFIQNIDNPFVSTQLLELLAANHSPLGYTTPTYKTKGGHPILVSQQIIQRINKLKSYTYDTNLRDILSQFKRKRIALSSDKILTNINTPDDYNKYFNQKEIISCNATVQT